MATSRGFAVNVLPQVPQVDARLFNTGGQFLGGLNTGLGAANSLINIAEQAETRPTRRRLAEINIAQGENELAMQPLNRQLRIAQIENALQEAAVPSIIPGDIVYEDTTRVLPAALDEEGNRTGEDDVVLGDIVAVQSEELIGPGGVRSNRQVRKTVKTAEQRAAEQAQLASRLTVDKARAAAAARGKEFEFESLANSYNQAVEEGDTDYANALKSRMDRLTRNPTIADGVTFQRKIEQAAADAGITLDRATELAKTSEGMAALTAFATANRAAARSAFAMPQPITPAQRALVEGAAQPAQPRAAIAQPVAPARSTAIPQVAIDYLLQNPSLADQFDAKYGAGAAQSVLNPRG